MIDLEKINFEKQGNLVPAIIVDAKSNSVLMLGFMNRESLKITIETGKVTFYSRRRSGIWTKGETSGNYLFVEKIIPDCDYDSLLIYANPAGITCHTGSYSCFGIEKENTLFLNKLFDLIKEREKERPAGSYTTSLFESGADRIIQKVGEEAIETCIAAKNRNKNEIVNESADLIYHLMVMLVEQGIELRDIIIILEERHSNKKRN